MRQFLLGLGVSAVFIAGCMAGASSVAVPTAKAARESGQRWAYLCIDASSAQDAHVKANAAGDKGWEMTAATTVRGDEAIWCFRRPAE
jgi:hypothetical protein